MLFLHVGGAGCGCGLEAARSSVFEIFSGVWSAAVWAAALSGQQPWPWLRCVATAAPMLRPCVHLSPLSSVQLSTLVTAPWPTPTQHLAAGWASLRTLAAPVPGLLRPSIALANLYRKLIAGQHCHRQGAEVIHRSNCCCC